MPRDEPLSRSSAGDQILLNGIGVTPEHAGALAIRAAGNSNVEELNDPAINNLFAKALATSNAAARNAIWPQIDRRVMSAAVILPGIYGRALLYRNPHLTSVYVHQYYASYDYANLGVK
jgi:peptide/nickel transport system substrate-binding protein